MCINYYKKDNYYRFFHNNKNSYFTIVQKMGGNVKKNKIRRFSLLLLIKNCREEKCSKISVNTWFFCFLVNQIEKYK